MRILTIARHLAPTNCGKMGKHSHFKGRMATRAWKDMLSDFDRQCSANPPSHAFEDIARVHAKKLNFCGTCENRFRKSMKEVLLALF